jgi:two-component system sensor histidine kinase PilS (NtrC family)
MAAAIYRYRLVGIETATRLMLWSDILLLPFLMLVSGTFAYSIGLLLAIAFALGNSLISKGVMLRATVSSVLVTAALILGEYATGGDFRSYTNVLLLVLAFFAIGYLASFLSRRLKTTQVLINRQQIDIRNLTEVNAFVIQQLQTGAIVVDEKRRLHTGNAAAWQLLGREPAENDALLADLNPHLDHAVERWLEPRDRGEEKAENRYVDPDYTYEATFSSFGSESNCGILITLADMRQVSDRAQQLKLASLGQLVAGVAHEIRNPLNAIQQSAQLLEESEGLDESDRQLTQIIDKQSRRLNRLVTDILDASRTGRNAPIELDPASWLQEFLDHYQLSLDESPVTIELDVAAETGTLLFDPDQLQQILWNLLNNAKKHSQPREGNLDIRLNCSHDPDSDRMMLAVCDNGTALDIEDEERLFNPFYTTGSSGVGLGLFIAHELSRNNNARLDYRRIDERNCFQLQCMSTPDKS